MEWNRILSGGWSHRSLLLKRIGIHSGTQFAEKCQRFSWNILCSCHVESSLQFADLWLIHVYAPLSDASAEELLEFNAHVEEVMKQRKHTKLLIIMGDSNANFRQGLVSIGISAISGTEEKLWTLKNKKQKSKL